MSVAGVFQLHDNMHFILSKLLQVLLPVLCTLIVLTAAQEHYLRYNFTTGLLHFRCPLDSELTDKKLVVATFGRYNQQTTNGQVSRIAIWYNNVSTTYENIGKVVLNTRQYGLAGFLTDVRCEDSQTYYCDCHVSVQRGPVSKHLENFTSTPKGSCSKSQNVNTGEPTTAASLQTGIIPLYGSDTFIYLDSQIKSLLNVQVLETTELSKKYHIQTTDLIMKIVPLAHITIVVFLCCITHMQRHHDNQMHHTRGTTAITPVKTTKTSVRMSTSKKPSTSHRAAMTKITTSKRTTTAKTNMRTSTTLKRPLTIHREETTKITTTQRTTVLGTTTITPLSVRVTSTNAASASIRSTDVVRTSSSLVKTSSFTEKYASEETSTETTNGLRAGAVAGICVAVTAFTAVVVFIFLIIRSRRRNEKHHGFKQSSANSTLQTSYSITSGNVDINIDRLNPKPDEVIYFQLGHQADGGDDTFTAAPSRGDDTALSSPIAPDAAAYSNLHQLEFIESHTSSDATDDDSRLSHQEAGAKDIIYGNLQNDDSDDYNRLRRENGSENALHSDVVIVNNYDHLQNDDRGEYSRLCRLRKDGGTQYTILPFPDTYDHLQNSSITSTAPVCTDYDPAKLERPDAPRTNYYENIMHVMAHNKQYN